jgi:flagellar basal body-associated protein FliL
VVVKLDSITINLAGAHFLKLGIALQPTAAATELDGSKALDLAISEFSQMTIDELSTAEGRDKAKDELVARIKLTYVPEGTNLAIVTSLATTFEEASKEEAKAVLDAKTQTEAEAKKAEIHIDKLSAGDAIKRANSLSVQPEVYDIYFTEFLMQ